MKSLRKSFNNDKSRNISAPQSYPIISKPLSAAVPPQKVIRAQSNYKSRGPTELSFNKGDFFHVMRSVDVNGAWYEAYNPLNGSRGLVPRSMFEEFGKTAST
jgi:bud emergence protein 1